MRKKIRLNLDKNNLKKLDRSVTSSKFPFEEEKENAGRILAGLCSHSDRKGRGGGERTLVTRVASEKGEKESGKGKWARGWRNATRLLVIVTVAPPFSSEAESKAPWKLYKLRTPRVLFARPLEPCFGGGERTHKFSLFYSQRLVYIRNKRGKREKERETVLGWSKQRRENTGEETQRRTNVSWRGRKPRREARARGHLPLSPLSLSLVRSTFAQPYRPPFKSSLFPVALNFPPWKTSLVEGNRTF